MIEGAIYARLATDAMVRPLVTTANVVRIYRVFAKQEAALPYIVLTRIDTEHIQSNSGLSSLARARVQVDCYAATTEAVWDLAEKVKLALMAGGWQVGTLGVSGIYLLDTRELPVGPFDGSPRPVYRVMRDFDVWFAEEVPV